MPELQLLLPGIDPPPPTPPRRSSKARAAKRDSHTIFFAVFPDAEDAAAIAGLGARLHSEHALKGPLTAPHRLHVTLLDMGAYDKVRPNDRIARAIEAAAALAPPDFDVVFNRALSFSTSTFVLGGAEGLADIAAFRQRLGERMADAGFKPKAAYTPHMSLVYGAGRRVAAQPIEPVRFRASSFALIDSHVGQGAHEVLARWPA